MSTLTQNWLGLAGQVCVVTGAASGIGAAIAHTLAEVGARVALLDRDAEGSERVAAELRASGTQAVGIACDVSNEDSVREAAARVLAEFGPCNALINNAGMLRPGTLDEVSLADWNALLAVNLTGYLLCARAFAQQMRDNGGGSIVNISSIAGHFPQTRSGAYSASKAGVRLMSRQMAVEWGAHGIRSNVICPGMIRTPLSARFYEEPGFEQKRAAVTASGRIGEPQDIANAAIFLASPRSSYVNAAEIMVDGGMSSMLMDMVPRPGFNNGARV